MIYLLLGAGLLAVALIKKENVLETSPIKNFDQLYKKYGSMYGVDWKMLKTIAMNESEEGRDPSVAEGLRNPANVEGSKSTDGLSWGLMQVTLKTGKMYDAFITPQKLNDPDYSVKIAAQHVSYLLDQFSSVELRYLEWVVKAYNQGEGATFKERDGLIQSRAQGYWERYQRNYAKIKE